MDSTRLTPTSVETTHKTDSPQLDVERRPHQRGQEGRKPVEKQINPQDGPWEREEPGQQREESHPHTRNSRHGGLTWER